MCPETGQTPADLRVKRGASILRTVCGRDGADAPGEADEEENDLTTGRSAAKSMALPKQSGAIHHLAANDHVNTMKAFVFLFIAAGCFAISGCAACKKTTGGTGGETGNLSAYISLIRISADVDGSERIIFTPRSVRDEHKFWSPPKEVTFNSKPWPDPDHSPAGWRCFSRDLDLSRAWIVKRQGRDVIALEQTAKGFDLYLCDSPNGSAHYDVTIAVPRRVRPSPAATDGRRF